MVRQLNNLLSQIDLSTFSIKSFSETDFIDILIVAILIYYVIVWIKTTKAWSLFKGLSFIIFARAVSFVLELNTVSWIIDNAISAGLIALVVLFQPELRKVLERLGKGKFSFALFSEGEDVRVSARTVNEIIQAARSMSNAKTGALIVVEDQTDLSEYEQTGIPIDATISSQLLINIFEDKTPLHDGAVIVRDNRIVAATCILPLTTEGLEKDLGTRHRAAVGTSEATDAAILVVSEETGAVSIALGGKLYRDISDQQVREILLKGTEDGKGEKKKLVLWKGRRTDEENS